MRREWLSCNEGEQPAPNAIVPVVNASLRSVCVRVRVHPALLNLQSLTCTCPPCLCICPPGTVRFGDDIMVGLTSLLAATDDNGVDDFGLDVLLDE